MQFAHVRYLQKYLMQKSGAEIGRQVSHDLLQLAVARERQHLVDFAAEQSRDEETAGGEVRV
jgi:hypothetical protein